jgi:hypothetical protein
MSIPINEQETTFVFKRNSDKATIYSSDERMLVKLHELVKKNPNDWKLIGQIKINEKIVSETFECSKKLISLRTATPTFVMSEEQKRLATERLRAWWKNKALRENNLKEKKEQT